ncbi:hypothetical protein PHSY_007064 [Pseudozyma hubeiensis SY62]|uniref:Uncharacterized protein n=1 Tax=Pseudozyma hubeiensis (strain SY62) TaxID=1305764 RepID=R9PDK6_PSEHS|nr:hypothetical protein PHSY_007064 [Pseudozyma hubeiensis SY62]GAC99463.1 hypothetical protein PHSY_007064 [Pseudozyma hubeiensis SY62]
MLADAQEEFVILESGVSCGERALIGEVVERKRCNPRDNHHSFSIHTSRPPPVPPRSGALIKTAEAVRALIDKARCQDTKLRTSEPRILTTIRLEMVKSAEPRHA